jgi:hypothetical protein
MSCLSGTFFFMRTSIASLLLLFILHTGACAEEKTYDSLKLEIAEMRKNIAEAYQLADSTRQDSLISYAQSYLSKVICNELLPAWYGTVWDYNGITQTPRKGKIACGYFVTTVIRDAGFDIPRSAYGQLPSETLIKKFSSLPKRFHSSKMASVIEYMRKQPDGVYIVGLDSHVGFITKKGSELRFVHSNYYSPDEKVVEQKLSETSPLTDSNYRIIGELLNRAAIIKWISNEKYQ